MTMASERQPQLVYVVLVGAEGVYMFVSRYDAEQFRAAVRARGGVAALSANPLLDVDRAAQLIAEEAPNGK